MSTIPGTVGKMQLSLIVRGQHPPAAISRAISATTSNW